MNMMTMEDAKIENMSDRNLAIYLRDYAKCRSGEIRVLALAASNRILDLKKKAKQKQKRIPVSEKLPEEHKWMGTQRFGTTISDEVYVTFETPDGQRFTKHICFWNGGLSPAEQQEINVFYKGAKPIAWMPLPEPYRAEIGG